MANFLTVNGIVLPCAAEGGGNHAVTQLGESKRAIDGTLRVHRRVVKRQWSFRSTPQLAPTALAFRDLLLGRGHYWSFDNIAGTAGLYSSKGLGPTGAITGVTLAAAAPAPILGAGRVAISAGNSLVFTLGAGLLGIDVFAWVNVNSAGWNHIIKDDAGVVYTNGALAGAAAMISITLATGVVTLSAPAVSHAFDELVIVPYRVPSDWPAQIYAYQLAGSQWSQLAQLKVAGDGIDGNSGTAIVKAEPGALEIFPGSLSTGAFKPNLHTVAFQLDEI